MIKNKNLEIIKDDLYMENYKVPYEKAYLIAITPRSGSGMLCDILYNTGLVGEIKEYLHPNRIKSQIDKYNGEKSLSEVFSNIIEKRMDKNKIFGIKASYHQVKPYIEKNSFDILLPDIKIITLFRKNILKQAISLYIAVETNFFHTGDNEKNRKELLSNLEFNKDKIFNRMKNIYQEEQGWMNYLNSNTYSYIKLFYEDNIKDMNKTIKTILLHIGIEDEKVLKSTIKESRLKKTSDTINNDFYEKYMNDLELVNKTIKYGISKNRLI